MPLRSSLNSLFLHVLEWMEVWALLIPLTAILITPRQPHYSKNLKTYVWIALAINILIDIIGDFKEKWSFPPYLQTNSFLYNIHSIVRFLCFTSFFLSLDQPYLKKAKKSVSFLAMLASVIYFFFEPFNNPEHISAYFLAAEAFILLLFCVQYYLFILKYENATPKKGGDFWAVTGLSIYVVINFFIFLFYIDVLYRNWQLADRLWTLHNIAYLVFCIFLAKAFYVAGKH